jgi:hypothetical protein
MTPLLLQQQQRRGRMVMGMWVGMRVTTVSRGWCMVRRWDGVVTASKHKQKQELGCIMASPWQGRLIQVTGNNNSNRKLGVQVVNMGIPGQTMPLQKARPSHPLCSPAQRDLYRRQATLEALVPR